MRQVFLTRTVQYDFANGQIHEIAVYTIEQRNYTKALRWLQLIILIY